MQLGSSSTFPQAVRDGSAPRDGALRPALRLSNSWRDGLLRRMLASADVVSVLVAQLLLVAVFGGSLGQLLWSLAFLPAWIVLAKLLDLYDRDQRSIRHLTIDEVPLLLVWAVASTIVLALYLELTPAGPLPLADAVRLSAVAALSALTLRGIVRWAWRGITPPERAAIVGAGPLADALRRKIDLFPDIHVEVVHQLPELELERLRDPRSPAFWVDRLLVAAPWIEERQIRELVAFGRRRGVKVSIVPPARGVFGSAVQLNHVADLPVVEYATWDVSRSTLLLKRVLDVTVSAVALLVLSPLLLAIALVVAADGGRPILFSQRRVGLGGRVFRIYKFRTMVPDAETRLSEVVSLDQLPAPVFKLENDPRVTRVGRVLRRWSLDELPQLVNVLVGDMSLVGPRPEQVELVERYAPEDLFRLSVKPGLTGPMQVYGRGDLTFEERMSVERDYVENLSFLRDLRLLALTGSVVLRGRGAY